MHWLMKGVASAALVGAGAMAFAGADVLTFEDLEVTGGDSADVADGYTSMGYVFHNLDNVGLSDAFAVWATDSLFYPGSTALFNNGFGDTTRLSRIDAGAFDMLSIELCDAFLRTVEYDIEFVGTRADASTVSNTFSITDGANLNTFLFSGMTNIVKLEWVQGPSFGHQFDNVTLNPTVVPEPASMAALGFGAAALLRRRRKA